MDERKSLREQQSEQPLQLYYSFVCQNVKSLF